MILTYGKLWSWRISWKDTAVSVPLNLYVCVYKVIMQFNRTLYPTRRLLTFHPLPFRPLMIVRRVIAVINIFRFRCGAASVLSSVSSPFFRSPGLDSSPAAPERSGRSFFTAPAAPGTSRKKGAPRFLLTRARSCEIIDGGFDVSWGKAMRKGSKRGLGVCFKGAWRDERCVHIWFVRRKHLLNFWVGCVW